MRTDDRPNFLIFMTDQQRGDTVLPNHPCRTPNVDRFAAQGVTFTETFCPSPHCCPSRATFFTGLYPSEHGIWNNVSVANSLTRELRPGVGLWSQDLAETGYELLFSGKWHVSARTSPADHGWTQRETTGVSNPEWTDRDYLESRWSHIRNSGKQSTPESRKPGEILRPGYPPYYHYGIDEDPFGDKRVTEAALSAMKGRGRSSGPWCQFVGTLGPHDPYHVPQRFLDLYRDVDIPLPDSFEDRMTDKPGFYRRTRAFFDQLTPEEHQEAIRHYWAFCSYEDHLFGRLLETLESTGEVENTVVMYLSDHGDYTGEHGLWCKGLPCFRGAYHVPAVVRWPAGIRNPGRSVDAFVSLADFGPTVVEIAGAGHRSGYERRFAGSLPAGRAAGIMAQGGLHADQRKRAPRDPALGHGPELEVRLQRV